MDVQFALGVKDPQIQKLKVDFVRQPSDLQNVTSPQCVLQEEALVSVRMDNQGHSVRTTVGVKLSSLRAHCSQTIRTHRVH